MNGLPPLVSRAEALAERLGCERACTRETGRLLHVLAAQRGRARAGETGTGCGVGTAWMVSALRPEVPVVTVELDAVRAEAARSLFAGDPAVRVLDGDWRRVLPQEAPFDLVFHAGGGEQRPAVDGAAVFGLLAPGGTLVVDELTPGWASAGDPVRRFWLGHPDLAAVEVVLSRETAALVGVRVR